MKMVGEGGETFCCFHCQACKISYFKFNHHNGACLPVTMSWIKSTWKHRIRSFVLQKEFLFSFSQLTSYLEMFTLWWLGVCYPEAFSNPRIMGLISSVSKETFSFCHCRHLLRNLKRSLTLLPSSPIVLTVITQMLIAQKAAVRLGFKSPVDASGVSRINESEALRANELLWASSTDEAFAWVGQCGEPVSDDAAFTERLTTSWMWSFMYRPSSPPGFVFCSLHRLPEQHGCLFDHLGHGRQEAVQKVVKLRRKVGRSCQRIGEEFSWASSLSFLDTGLQSNWAGE